MCERLLTAALEDANPRVRRRAVEALERMDPFPVKLAKTLLMKPSARVGSRANGFAVNLLCELVYGLNLLLLIRRGKLRFVDWMSLLFGKGICSTAVLSRSFILHLDRA